MTLTNHPGFRLAPVAAATGPFCTEGFLAVVAKYDDGVGLVAASNEALLPLRRVDDMIRFTGDADVTDYHSPFGDGSEALIASVAQDHPDAGFVLDSLPEEAAAPLVAGLSAAGRTVTERQHEVTAVVALPDTIDDYMTAIGKKERHEVRRKRRRYENLVGEVRHQIHTGDSWAFDEFVRLHRRAAGDKGSFLTTDRVDFFSDLATLDGWRIDLLELEPGRAAAAIFGFVDETGYYLYNSGYDPDLAEASPGVVLLSVMIEQAIADGQERFDFLKGDEVYKFRLGAEPRPLVEIVAGKEEH